MGHYIPEEIEWVGFTTGVPTERGKQLRCYVCDTPVESITIDGPYTVERGEDDVIRLNASKSIQNPCGHELPLPVPEVPSVPTQ